MVRGTILSRRKVFFFFFYLKGNTAFIASQLWSTVMVQAYTAARPVAKRAIIQGPELLASHKSTETTYN